MKLTSILAAVVAMPLTVTAAAQDDIQTLEATCTPGFTTPAQASACLMPLQVKAMALGRATWEAVQASREIDLALMNGEESYYFKNRASYDEACRDESAQPYKAGTPIWKYLDQAEFCLAMPAELADGQNVEHDRTAVEHALSLIRRLGQYDHPRP